MASLIDNLVEVLEQENNEYQKLTAISQKKTPVLVSGDLQRIQDITLEEQAQVEIIAGLEKKRTEALKDISTVLGKPVKELSIRNLAKLLAKQKDVSERLLGIHAQLKITMDKMVKANEINKKLVEENLEMIEYNINFLRSLGQGPDVANYGKDAFNTNGSTLQAGSFDAKQ